MKFILILVFPLLLLSCNNSPKKPASTQGEIKQSAVENNRVQELTTEQEAAFDALDVLQMRTDEISRLYSTFPNHTQPCYPADSSFEISQSEFLEAMKVYTSRHCQNLPEKRRQVLTESSVKAQDVYKVLHCKDDSQNEKVNIGLPMKGTWVLPNVLGHRDIILTW